MNESDAGRMSDGAFTGSRDTAEGSPADPIAAPVSPLAEWMRKAAARASGWFSSGIREPRLISVEMVDALAEDVIALTREIESICATYGLDRILDDRHTQIEMRSIRIRESVERLCAVPECPASPPRHMKPCQKEAGHTGAHGALDGSYSWR